MNITVDAGEEILALLKEQEEQIKNRDESLEKAREEIKWLWGMLKEQEWIPVKERIPADGSDILVYYDDGEESRIAACNYDNGVWFDCVFNTLIVFKNITHWMPLPKPPKK